jgi:DNA-binding SARP family transcriptional activator
MLTYRDRSFTPETLTDQLWVTEEYSDSRSTLRRQMSRLRQLLDEDINEESEPSIVYKNGYYRWNETLSIQVDVDLFDSLIKQGDAVRLLSPDKALGLYQEALELYVGDYLPDCAEQHWVFPVRNQYRRIFLKTMLTTIDMLKSQENYDLILQLCQKAILIDTYEESFHVNLLEAMIVKGEYRQAFEHYASITNFYEREMGIKPSEAMRGLYKRLLQSQQTIESREALDQALEDDTFIENAFYCEMEVFKSIYELERRRSERSGASFSIGVLNMPRIKGDTYSQREARLNALKEHLMQHLRKGDTLTRWSDEQLVALLPGVDAQLMENILQRVLHIENQFVDVTISQIKQLTALPSQYRS